MMTGLRKEQKIIVLGDLHLGKKRRQYPERDADVLIALREVITEEAPDVVIFAGDLFDSPSPPLWLVRSVLDILHPDQSLASYGQKMFSFFIMGNHDKGISGSSLDVFASSALIGAHRVIWQWLDGSTFYAGDQFKNRANLRGFVLAAYGSQKDLELTARGPTEIFIGHGTHPESPLAPPIEHMNMREVVFPPREDEPREDLTIILGHLHGAHEFHDRKGRRVIYTGPLVQTAQGEGDPGYVCIRRALARREDAEKSSFRFPGHATIRLKKAPFGRRFVDFSEWDGDPKAIVRAVCHTEEEKQMAEAALALAQVERYEVLYRPQHKLSQVSKVVLDGFSSGGVTQAYIRYRKALGKEPVPQVVQILRAVG